jgi:hypothetical protein
VAALISRPANRPQIDPFTNALKTRQKPRENRGFRRGLNCHKSLPGKGLYTENSPSGTDYKVEPDNESDSDRKT